MFGWLRRRREHQQAAYRLYGAVIERARARALYDQHGVPDTLDGRFDSVVLHAHLVMRRLADQGPNGARLSQVLFDVMFADMDQTLRELGVGDLTVGKKVRQMADAFFGRAVAYEKALEPQAGPAELETALLRNIYRGVAPAPAALSGLAAYVRGLDGALAGLSLAEFSAGALPAIEAKCGEAAA